MNDLVSADITEERDKIRGAISSRPLPLSVRDFKIEFGTDSIGDPAVTIWLIVDDDPNPPKPVLEQTTLFVRAIENDLMALGLRHWPYVRFMLASEAQRYLA